MNVYQMCVNNIAHHIRSKSEGGFSTGSDDAEGESPDMDAFTASSVLSVAFCKAKEDVILDIMKATGG
jgi:hypothetical protein